MSFLPAQNPECPGDPPEFLETLIIPRARDLGGFDVRRVLPARERQMVGPFIFFDQMGPAELITGKGIDVRPHPHIGLATVTYLFGGEVHHRDSLGTDQVIRPGAVNLMVAGSGITHSERTPPDERARQSELFGIQTWIALPDHLEDTDPSFEHSPREALPVVEDSGITARLILGTAWGETAPASTFSEMFYADVWLEAGASAPLPDAHEDRGAYVLDGAIDVAGHVFEAGQMLVFRPDQAISMTAGENGARVLILGGETLNGPRHIWWNFVASSKEKIDAAREAWKTADWQNGPFKLPPGDDDEYIAL